jgi:organic radical activating enzyme
MHSIERLDVMVAYSCNISCDGCISLSDRKRSGIEPLNRLSSSFNQWKDLINPKVIAIFGGEPCLHPNLIEICAKIRHEWPESTIRLITNGYLLDRFSPDVWFEFSPFEMQVSIHRRDHESKINEQIKNILLIKKSWKTIRYRDFTNHKQIEWVTPGFKIYKSIFSEFIIPYKKNREKIESWYSDPAESHKICGSPATPILFKDRLYKCPAVANTIDILGENWFGYKGYGINDDISELVSNINRPESVCGQCPDRKQAQVINHFDIENVHVKSRHVD